MGKPRRIHPTPAQVFPALPVAVAALAAALSPEEKDVLFYLLSAASGQPSNLQRSPEHSPDLSCGCFSCYKVFWERWDSSPNRQVIHEIIEKVEEASEEGKSPRRSRRTRGRDRKKSSAESNEEIKDEMLVGDTDHDHDVCNDHDVHDDGCSAHDNCSDGANKISVLGRFVRFIGEKLYLG